MKNSPAAKIMIGIASLLMVSACAGTKSTKVAELTRQDKHMDCTTLQLEMTEAEFLRDKAERNRGMSLKNIVMPLGYPSTYFSAEGAVDAASTRLDYLTRLYEIKGCANQNYNQASAQVPQDAPAMAPMQGGFQPTQYVVVPVQNQQPTYQY